jgi:serine/threonine protein phosphatase PrpC
VAASPNSAGPTGLGIEFGQSSDPGLDPAKRVNEDACGYAETRFGHMFVMCDGMGGHAGGKEASNMAIRTVFDTVARAPANAPPQRLLVQSIEEAALRVYELGGPASNLQRPGSTCVALLLHDGRMDVAHVGDSRAYAVRGKQIYRLTRDHSMVQELLDQGVIGEQEAIGHPDSNKITRALGMTPEVEVELREEPMEVYEGDVFVLATDGLTDLARNDDILLTVNEFLRTNTIQAASDELVALANRRGGHDNITVQVVRVLKTGPKSTRTLAQGPVGHSAEIITPAAPAGAPVTTTVDGAPAHIVGDTVVQEPALAGQNHHGPLDNPAPHARPVHEQPVHEQPARRHEQLFVDPAHHAPTHYTEDHRRAGPTMLTYVVLAMAGIIGLLLALLMWALFYR